MRSVCLITAFTLLITVAAKTPTVLAPREFPSGQTTCYSQCPSSIDGNPYDGMVRGGRPGGGEAVTCVYNNGDEDTAYCRYNLDGSLYDQSYTDNCPQQAALAGCGSENPSPDKSFRRRSIPKRETKAEKIIKSRQYKFSKTR